VKLSERLEALLGRMTNGHVMALQCMEFIRDHGPALAELARRVEEAAVGRRYAHAEDDWIVTPDEDGGVTFPYQRVRIMPIEDQEVTGED
jgi:4-hydroxyphenylpyruvate dioxygenase-like putative hemolysin